MFGIIFLIFMWYLWAQIHQKKPVNITQLMRKEQITQKEQNKVSEDALFFICNCDFTVTIAKHDKIINIKKEEDAKVLVDFLQSECLKTKAKKIDDLTKKLLNAKSNKEYDKINKEIRRLESE